MDKGYRQLTLKERKEIEDGLNRGDSFRAIARLIGRSPSTVSREVLREQARSGLQAPQGSLPRP
jgi:IS30 family transposase